MPEIRKIDAEDDGIRLDRWFRRHYPAVTHTLLEKLLRKGEIRLDGSRVKAADRVGAGQALKLPPQVIHARADAPEKPKAETPKPMGSLADRILYMDKHVIVLDKPPGLATQGGSGITRHVDGMLDSLMFEKNTRPKLVHRLDKDTSGVLLVARTTLAASGLSTALASRDASKVYWALTRGVPKQRHGFVKGALAKEGGRGNEKMAISEGEEAKFALTEYTVLDTTGDEFAFVAARPVTGRTHQIRVHLASLGTPIVGDFKYGGPDAKGKGEVADRLHLHAREIDIARPDGGRLKVSAPLPPHMEKSWQVLGFNLTETTSPFAPKKHVGETPKAPHRPETPRGKALKPPMQKARRKATSTGRKRKRK
jgi:23S rRNA pseudouridine955/2504/2580 synthase